MPQTLDRDPRLDEATMREVATGLAAAYEELCGEQTIDSHASLSGNLLAWVFEDGLAPVDLGLLAHGRTEELRSFRQGLFGALGERLEAVVEGVTGVPVTYSFFGFDPDVQTTRGVFLLDLERQRRRSRQELIVATRLARASSRHLRAEQAIARRALRASTDRLRRNHDLYRKGRDAQARRRRAAEGLRR